jgi:ATP-dependent DNA ligase
LWTSHFGGYAQNVSIAKVKIRFIEPMLALAVTQLPEGRALLYELKFDGHRGLRSKPL